MVMIKIKKRWVIEKHNIASFNNNSSFIKEKSKIFKNMVNYSNEEVLIDPYYLGIWLGDGISECITSFCSADKEIVNYCNDYAKKLNLKLVQTSHKKEVCQTYRLSEGNIVCHKNHPLAKYNKQYNLNNNKHIPIEYLTSCEINRLKLLAGLVDSDGYVNHGYIEIIQKNNKLSNDIIQLCNSLGFDSYSRKVIKKSQNDAYGEYNQITIRGNISRIPTLLDRKKSCQSIVRNILHSSFIVSKITKGYYYLIKTDGDGSFMMHDCTVFSSM